MPGAPLTDEWPEVFFKNSKILHIKKPSKLECIPSRKTKREKLAERAHMTCFWCKQTTRYQLGYQNSATIEHLIPTSAGGPNKITNLRSACVRCNNNRGSMPAEDFAKIANGYVPDVRTIVLAKKEYLKDLVEAGKSNSKTRYRDSLRLAKFAVETNDISIMSGDDRAKRLYATLQAKKRLDLLNSLSKIGRAWFLTKEYISTRINNLYNRVRHS